MRKLYKNFITEEEAEQILNNIPTSHLSVKTALNKELKPKHLSNGAKDVSFIESFIKKINNQLKNDFIFNIKKQSYFHIEETRNSGHSWHIDTGTNNHMLWCEIGLSIILKEGNGGGETYYADNKNGLNKIKSNRKMYDLIAHTSDEWHKVAQSYGGRFVFLMFS